MNQGSVFENILSRTILKHIRKNNKKVTIGAAIGNDYSRINVSERQEVVSAIGFATFMDSQVDMAKVAFIKALNNFSMSGGSPIGIQVNIMMPTSVATLYNNLDEDPLIVRDDNRETKRIDKFLKVIMETLNELCNHNKIQIMGGHTEISRNFNKPSISITMIGEVDKDITFNTKNIKAGDEIIMTGFSGAMGASLIANIKEKELLSRFASSYINEAKCDIMGFSLDIISKIAIENNALYMHDVSCGGLYGALGQVASKISKGIAINHEAISIKQETIEICEFYDINPYMLDGTGSVIVITRNASELLAVFSQKGIEASIIGEVLDSNEKIIINGDEKRFLTPAMGDEIYQI